MAVEAHAHNFKQILSEMSRQVSISLILLSLIGALLAHSSHCAI